MGEDYRKLTREELNELAGEELPERAAMSLINANIAAPIDAAVSANILSPDAVSLAGAHQDAVTLQTLEGLASATTDQSSTIDQGENIGIGTTTP